VAGYNPRKQFLFGTDGESFARSKATGISEYTQVKEPEVRNLNICLSNKIL
jgi:hypothetical protein